MKLFANELEANQQVQTTFLVLNKDVRQKKTGEPYLSLVLGDKTGEIDAKMWDGVAEIVDTFERNDYVKIRGQATVYQNKLQLRVDRLMRADERDVEPADYFPASKRDRDEMYAELMGYIDTMRNPHLKALLEAFFADSDIAKRYKTAPAAKTIHHAWIGGLIEHVLSLMTLARFTARHYPEVDEDLLLTGVVLHDIGKIHELTYDRGFGYSDEGQLIGHILIALRMLDEKIRCPASRRSYACWWSISSPAITAKWRSARQRCRASWRPCCCIISITSIRRWRRCGPSSSAMHCSTVTSPATPRCSNGAC